MREEAVKYFFTAKRENYFNKVLLLVLLPCQDCGKLGSFKTFGPSLLSLHIIKILYVYRWVQHVLLMLPFITLQIVNEVFLNFGSLLNAGTIDDTKVS